MLTTGIVRDIKGLQLYIHTVGTLPATRGLLT